MYTVKIIVVSGQSTGNSDLKNKIGSASHSENKIAEKYMHLTKKVNI